MAWLLNLEIPPTLWCSMIHCNSVIMYSSWLLSPEAGVRCNGTGFAYS